MLIYYFDPDKPAMEEFECDKVVGTVERIVAVNTTTNEQRSIPYFNFIYIINN